MPERHQSPGGGQSATQAPTKQPEVYDGDENDSSCGARVEPICACVDADALATWPAHAALANRAQISLLCPGCFAAPAAAPAPARARLCSDARPRPGAAAICIGSNFGSMRFKARAEGDVNVSPSPSRLGLFFSPLPISFLSLPCPLVCHGFC